MKGEGGRREKEPARAGGGSEAYVVERILASMEGGVLGGDRGGRIRTASGTATRTLGHSAPPEAGADLGAASQPAEERDISSRTVPEAVSRTGTLG